eukprot:751347-Hanusia_phi.AAC.10
MQEYEEQFAVGPAVFVAKVRGEEGRREKREEGEEGEREAMRTRMYVRMPNVGSLLIPEGCLWLFYKNDLDRGGKGREERESGGRRWTQEGGKGRNRWIQLS